MDKTAHNLIVNDGPSNVNLIKAHHVIDIPEFTELVICKIHSDY